MTGWERTLTGVQDGSRVQTKVFGVLPNVIDGRVGVCHDGRVRLERQQPGPVRDVKLVQVRRAGGREEAVGGRVLESWQVDDRHSGRTWWRIVQNRAS
jgi:hypothetical protein